MDYERAVELLSGIRRGSFTQNDELKEAARVGIEAIRFRERAEADTAAPQLPEEGSR